MNQDEFRQWMREYIEEILELSKQSRVIGPDGQTQEPCDDERVPVQPPPPGDVLVHLQTAIGSVLPYDGDANINAYAITNTIDDLIQARIKQGQERKPVRPVPPPTEDRSDADVSSTEPVPVPVREPTQVPPHIREMVRIRDERYHELVTNMTQPHALAVDFLIMAHVELAITKFEKYIREMGALDKGRQETQG